MNYKRWLVLDIETVADPRVELPEPEPDSRLRDPAKVLADMETKLQRQQERASLDGWTGAVAAIGTAEQFDQVETRYCQNVDEEIEALKELSSRVRQVRSESLHLIGYNLVGFDWPFLMARALVLGVQLQRIELRPYNTADYTDLMLDPSVKHGVVVLPRRLSLIHQRLGCVQLLDPVGCQTGADVQTAAKEGRWADIAGHCHCDVQRTLDVAERFGVIQRSA